jgi:TusA-related sulfurtransferase
MPIVRINKAIKQMSKSDDTLRVEADDPAFKMDVEAWAKKTGHQILSLEQEGQTFTATLKRS